MKLELDLNEVNGILSALAQLPYAQVEGLISKIRTQVMPQLAEEPVTVEEKEEDN